MNLRSFCLSFPKYWDYRSESSHPAETVFITLTHSGSLRDGAVIIREVTKTYRKFHSKCNQCSHSGRVAGGSSQSLSVPGWDPHLRIFATLTAEPGIRFSVSVLICGFIIRKTELPFICLWAACFPGFLFICLAFVSAGLFVFCLLLLGTLYLFGILIFFL